MICVSWNVNGIRAILKKGLIDILAQLDADIVCLQEIKARSDQFEINSDMYPFQYVNSAERNGYSGTMVICKNKPLSIDFGMGVEAFDNEGRVITVEYPDVYIVNVYVPTSGIGLKRLDFRLGWDVAFGKYVKSLNKPVMICGDLNVSNNYIDVIDPFADNFPGFTEQERASFRENLLDEFVDTYRMKYPERIQFSWWSYIGNARANNQGLRLDYWLVSRELKDCVVDSMILDDIYGSDHCPILLDINIESLKQPKAP